MDTAVSALLISSMAQVAEHYVLSVRASWLNFGNKGDLALLYAGDPVLFNHYAYIPVNLELHPHGKNDQAMALEKWLIGPKSAEMISTYKINGEVLFTFNATTN